MTDLVDQMFPPIHRKWAADYTDFNYWKPPIQEFPLPDLTPPSPALSARSDTSNQSTFSRLRNFSLVGTKQTKSRPSILPQYGGDAPKNGDERSTQLKQMSSFERLSVTLASITGESRRSTSRESRTSTSLTYADSASDDEYLDDDDLEKGSRGRGRSRRRSMTSMPGSLDDAEFDLDGDEQGAEHDDSEEQDGEGVDEEEGEIEDEEGAIEEAFDEAFFKTSQMKNVPFL
jgi:phosphatidate phosphatase LPIN